jgi:hypothetical protein
MLRIQRRERRGSGQKVENGNVKKVGGSGNRGWGGGGQVVPMRPKSRGLAQHGGPPGGLEESDPAGCDFVRWTVHAASDGPHHLSRSGADLLLNVHKTPS